MMPIRMMMRTFVGLPAPKVGGRGHGAVIPIRRAFAVALLLALAAPLPGCSTTPVVEDPLAALENTESGPRVQLQAMALLDEAGDGAQYVEALERVLWRPGYMPDVRAAAFERLRVLDEAALKRTLRQQLPRMTAWQGLTRLCELIADAGWVDLSPALVSSWARPTGKEDDEDRPEYKALARLYGADHVQDVVFEMMLTENRAWQEGLRTRCWMLLHRLGDRARIVELLRGSEVPADDAFLLDLRAGAVDLGIVPITREEILWMQALRAPERRAFWDEAVAAVQAVPESRRADLELRDVPILVAAAAHASDLPAKSAAELYAELEPQLRGRRHFSHASKIEGYSPGRRERLNQWRDELTWGDLAAIELALRALAVPEVVAHLFDYAERDLHDESTEYGGVITLDPVGRFEILEFPPRIRRHDQMFLASQAMLDAAYTAPFHFHLHCQRHWNRDYAGPGPGDIEYADNMRANCLVFTYVDEGVMNVDYYRHGRVIVDLGTIELGHGGLAAHGAAGRGDDEGRSRRTGVSASSPSPPPLRRTS